jgi:serine/threonine protein kinase
MRFHVRDKYVSLAKIGEAGGQGQVWKGRREADGELFALKTMVPDPNSPDPAEDQKRFRREIRCQTTLRHPRDVRSTPSTSHAGTRDGAPPAGGLPRVQLARS